MAWFYFSQQHIGQTCTSFPVSAGSINYVDSASCHEMTTVVPAGANPINGAVQVCVTNSVTVPVVNGVPYVPGHYDISPVNNASTATARIIIYFTQQDFNLYNAAAPTAPQLPIGPADAAGIANIIIEQDHGFSATGVPGTYNGTTVFIDPNDNDIVWNAANGYWAVSFDVTAFSGFFMTTVTVTPVKLSSFSGRINNKSINLFWTTSLEINVHRFDIQRSNDGNNFSSIGNQAASGIENGSSYSYNDKDPIHGRNYYRLISVDVDGSKQYSNTIHLDMVQADKTDFTLTPNPSHTQCVINIAGVIQGKTSIVIHDLTGKQVQKLYSGDLNSNAFSKTFSVAI